MPNFDHILSDEVREIVSEHFQETLSRATPRCEVCGAAVAEGMRACPGLSPCWHTWDRFAADMTSSAARLRRDLEELDAALERPGAAAVIDPVRARTMVDPVRAMIAAAELATRRGTFEARAPGRVTGVGSPVRFRPKAGAPAAADAVRLLVEQLGATFLRTSIARLILDCGRLWLNPPCAELARHYLAAEARDINPRLALASAVDKDVAANHDTYVTAALSKVADMIRHAVSRRSGRTNA